MEGMRRKYNSVINLSKFTFNKKKLNKFVTTSYN